MSRCVVCWSQFTGREEMAPEACACRYCYNARCDERDEARALLAEAWEWTSRTTPGKLGYVGLEQRVRAALGREADRGES